MCDPNLVSMFKSNMALDGFDDFGPVFGLGGDKCNGVVPSVVERGSSHALLDGVAAQRLAGAAEGCTMATSSSSESVLSMRGGAPKKTLLAGRVHARPAAIAYTTLMACA